MKNEHILKTASESIKDASNYWEVDSIINEAIFASAGFLNIGLLKIKNLEEYTRVYEIRKANIRLHRRRIYKLLLPFAKDSIKKSRLYKEKLAFWTSL